MDRFEILLGKGPNTYSLFVDSLYELKLGEHMVSENWDYSNLPSRDVWNAPQNMFTMFAPSGVSFLF
jgi:hypothetical protein